MGARLTLVVVSAAMLAACAQEPAEPMVEHKPGLTLRADRWVVTDAFPGGQQPSLVGQTITLKDTEATDLAGRVCPTPSYAPIYGNTLGGLLGGDDPRPAVGLEVRCGPRLMARFAHAPDQSLMVSHQGQLFRLEPEDEVAQRPQPATAPAKAEMKPMEAAPEPVAPVADPEPEPALVYLESYRSEKAAMAAWAKMGLKGAQPLTRMVDLGRKGKFVRLFAATHDDPQLVCKQLKMRKDACGVPVWMKM